MSVVATNANAFQVRFAGCTGGVCSLVVEGDVIVYEVTDCLNAMPARADLSEQLPTQVQEPIALAEAACEQKNERFVRQVFDRNLTSVRDDRIGLAAIANDCGCGDLNPSRRGNDARTPVAETVAVPRQRRGWGDDDVIGIFEIANPTVVNVEGQDTRSWLRKMVSEFVPDLKSHDVLTGL